MTHTTGHGGRYIEVDIAEVGTPASGREVADILVVIDVIRAFSTVCALFAGGVSEVICARDYDEAVRIGTHSILVGEAEVPLGAVVPNSPAAVSECQLLGRTAVLFTLNGTRALFDLAEGPVVMAASLSNVTATARWILENSSGELVRLIVTDPDSPEDLACARYLKALLQGKSPDPVAVSFEVAQARDTHWQRWGATVTDQQWRDFEVDVRICARVDSFGLPLFVDLHHESPPTISTNASGRA